MTTDFDILFFWYVLSIRLRRPTSATIGAKPRLPGHHAAGSSGVKGVTADHWLRVASAWAAISMPCASDDDSAEWVEFVMEVTLSRNTSECCG